jgi:tetratricopeptide (TPR) repeat protein
MATTLTSRQALRRGQTLARANKLDDALAAFEAAGESDNPQLLIHHALTLARAGQADAALAKSAKAAAVAPDDVVPTVFNAYLMLRSARLDDAATELERARGLSPKNPLVPSLEAAHDVLSGRVVEGCEKLLAGPVTDNLDVLGWIVAAVETALFERAGLRAAEGTVPPDAEHDRDGEPGPDKVAAQSARRCMSRGEKLLEAGCPQAAAAYLKRATDEKPGDVAARAMYGAALFEAGRFEQAEGQLSRVPKESPMAGVAQFYRAATAYRLGNHETALELLDTLPMKGDVFLYQEWCDYIRAMALLAAGRTDEAARHLAAFIDIEPDTVERRLKKTIELLREDDTCSTQS